MNHTFKTTAFFLFFFLFSTGTSFSQNYGQIFSKSEANQDFGAVTSTITITTSQLQNVLNKTANVLMFRIKDSNLLVLGDDRNVLYGSTESIPPADVYKVYSKSKINELIKSGGTNTVFIE